MWFLFGLITLISFCVFNVYKRINAAWKGEKATTNNVDYQYKLLTEKDEIETVMLGIEGPAEFDFILKREKAVDRFFKRIGLAKEHQVGNKEFDELVYVVSDHTALHQEISEKKGIIDSVIRLFTSRSGYGVNIQEIRCNSGRIWFSYKPSSGFEEEDIEKLATATVPLLKSISEQLKSVHLSVAKKWKDPFVFKAAIILAVSSSLLLNGLAHSYRINFIDIPFTIDTEQMLIDTAIWGAVFISFLIVTTLLILGRSSRTHLVLVELLIVGSIGTFLTVHAQMRDLNMEMDESPSTHYEVETHNKKIVSGRRSTSYYIYVDDWTEEKIKKKIEVSSSFYESVSKGDKLMIKQKIGYLDYRWVSNVVRI